MRNQILKVVAASVVGAGALVLGAHPAAAASATHGVIFIHGTGDYPVAGQTTASTSALTCTTVSGNAGKSCYAPAAYGGTNYWEANEVSAVSAGRPFAVVGFYGGSCAPWPKSASTENAKDATDGTWSATSTASSCPLATGVGNADIIAGQIQQFLNANPNMNELAIVTHSGGSNQARYILNNYTRSSSFSTIRSLTKRVITLAGTTEGTYLANEVFAGAVPGADLVAGLVGFGGEAVNLLRTTNISTYNSSSSYLGPIANPVGGVNFYSSGGVSTNVCFGVYVAPVCIFGFCSSATCVGTTGPTLGILPSGDHDDVYVTGNSCDSEVDDIALLALNDLFLNANDSSTYRNSCSDGFISCMGSQALGNTFSYSGGQDHNQSRRECNNLQNSVASMVSGSASGFDYSAASFNVSPHQLDACGFGTYAQVTNSRNQTVGWTEGCQPSQLGNGNCDWDCVALYGNDAVVTSWADAPNNTIPLTWGQSDCTASAGAYNGATYNTTSTLPFADNQVAYTSSGSQTVTAFNGNTCTGSASQCGGYTPTASTSAWFYDPNWGDTETTTAKSNGSSNGPGYFSTGFCPESWIGDGTCDECVLALYGADGMDCAPGHIAQCGGIVTQSEPYNGAAYYYYNNPIYNEGLPSDTGGDWLLWQSMPAVSGDGVCEETECAQGTGGATGMTSTGGVTTVPTSSGTPCTTSSQCPGNIACNTTTGYCYACSLSGLSCNSSTYGWSGGTCNPNNGNCYSTATIGAQCSTNSDCLSGSCVNGGCTTQGTDCSATYTASATACTENNNCNGDYCIGGTCAVTGGACASDANCPGPTGATSTCNAGFCSCTTTSDCSNGASCSNPSGATAAGSCATSVSISLCR